MLKITLSHRCLLNCEINCIVYRIFFFACAPSDRIINTMKIHTVKRTKHSIVFL